MGVYKVLEQLLTKREGEEMATDAFSCLDRPAVSEGKMVTRWADRESKEASLFDRATQTIPKWWAWEVARWPQALGMMWGFGSLPSFRE